MTFRLIAVATLASFAGRAADPGANLLAAARKGDAAQIAALVAKGAPIETKDKNGRTALMLAAQRGYVDAVRTLLAHGANPDARDRQGWTAFGLALFSSAEGHDEALRVLPQPPKVRIVVDARWTPENLYSSCLMSPPQLAQHVAAIEPEMLVLGALRDIAAVSAKRMIELVDQRGDAVLVLRARPGAACVAQQSADNLSLAVDVKLERARDQKMLLEKIYGGGLKGLHARSVTSPAQYGSLYADWAKNHASAIFWNVLEAWLRAQL